MLDGKSVSRSLCPRSLVEGHEEEALSGWVRSLCTPLPPLPSRPPSAPSSRSRHAGCFMGAFEAVVFVSMTSMLFDYPPGLGGGEKGPG